MENISKKEKAYEIMSDAAFTLCGAVAAIQLVMDGIEGARPEVFSNPALAAAFYNYLTSVQLPALDMAFVSLRNLRDRIRASNILYRNFYPFKRRDALSASLFTCMGSLSKTCLLYSTVHTSGLRKNRSCQARRRPRPAICCHFRPSPYHP